MNEAFAVTDTFGFTERTGREDHRAPFGQPPASATIPASPMRSWCVRPTLEEKLKAGLDLRLDANQRVAVEIIGMAKRLDRSSRGLNHSLERHRRQNEAVQGIRDSIELPFLRKTVQAF
jgi:hypothetical protein